MNIIFVPKSAGRGRNISFSKWQIIVLGLTVIVGVPALVGTVSYRIVAALDTREGTRSPEYLVRQERMLKVAQQGIETERRAQELHVNALAQRLGYMQAQLLRLNALGQRLTRMGGLDKREFDFTEQPGIGGPEKHVPASLQPQSRLTIQEFTRRADSLQRELERKSERMTALESVLMDRQLQAAVFPNGWPTEGGWVSSTFGIRTDPFTGRAAYHEGIDIASRMGSPIKAMGGGVVSHSGEKEGYGLVVEINHGNGYTTRYAHARAVLVKVGDRVQKGQDVALVGSSGRSTGPHLHFEVLREGRAVNPASYLRNG